MPSYRVAVPRFQVLGKKVFAMFETFDAVLLARIQFAFTVTFHFLFPAITIWLVSYLAVLEGLWLKNLIRN